MHFLANGDHVDLVVSAGGGIAALRSLSAAMGKDPVSFDAAGFSREVRITLGRLPEPLRQQVQEAHFEGPRTSAENLYFEVRPHLQRLGIQSSIAPAKPATDPTMVAGAAVEAAQRHLRGDSVAFEFFVVEANRWEALFQRFDSKRRRYVVAAVLAFIVLPMLLFFIRGRIEGSLASEWKGMQKNVAELELIQTKIRQFRPWFEPAPQSVQMLEGLSSAFPEQGDVWAKSIQISDDAKVTCSGFARNQSVLMALLDRLRSRPDVANLQIQQVRGDNPVQFSVTYKWEAQNAQ